MAGVKKVSKKLFFIVLILFTASTGIFAADNNEKEDKKLTEKPSYHNIVSTVQKFISQDSVEAIITRNLFNVQKGKMTPEAFFHQMADLELPRGKQARHILQKIKKDLHNDYGQEGLDLILGPRNPPELLEGKLIDYGGSPVEGKLLEYRQKVVLQAVKDVCVEFNGKNIINNHKFKIFMAEIGSWSTKAAKHLTFAADIDFSFMSGDLNLAWEMKKAYEAKIKERTHLTAEQIDAPVTAHGMAEHEVYLGKHGQGFAEDYIKSKDVYEIKDGQLKNAKGEGVSGRQALRDIVLDRRFADVKVPDLINIKHPGEPGISLEMIRHFNHDIVYQNITGDIDSFVKAAKYLKRSMDSLQKISGSTKVNTSQLAKFADQLIAAKDGNIAPIDQVELIKQYFRDINQDIPFDIKLGPENRQGLSKVQINTKEMIIKGFWDDCNKTMWDNVAKGFEIEYKKVKKFMTPKDKFYAKKHHQTIKKMYEMMQIENVIMHDSNIGLKKIPPKFEKIMKKFDSEYKAFTSKWGIELLDDAGKAQMKFVKENIKVSIDQPKNHNIDLAMAALTSLAEAPIRFNDYLDVLDNTLMNDLRTGEWKHYLAEARRVTFDKKVENFLAGTGLEKTWQKTNQGKFKKFLKYSSTQYVKAENRLNKMLLDNFAANGVTAINKHFSEAVAGSKATQGAMAAMAVLSLKDELPVYYNAFSEGEWEKLAVEFFRRRVPFGGTVENIVMGQYYSATWGAVTTLIPHAALIDAVYAISNDIGTKAYKATWTEELDMFVDELYENAKFSVKDVVKHGYDLEITRWSLVSTEYKHVDLNLSEEIANMEKEVRDMDQWWSKYGKIDPNKRPSFPSHKYQDNLLNWMKVNDMLWMNIRARDNVLMYLDGVQKAYKFGEITELYYIYMRQIRWAKVKLQFLHHLKEQLEERRRADKVILDGNDQKIRDELMSIASKLGIKDQVEENLEADVGGDVWEYFAAARDWLHGIKRELLWDPDLWEEYREKIKIINGYLETYKGIWEARKNLETYFTMSEEDKQLVRLLTGPEFLTGNPDKDKAIVNEWQENIKAVYKEIGDKLKTIKSKYVQEDLDLNQGSFDYNTLKATGSAEILKKIYIWSFRHMKKGWWAKHFQKPKEKFEQRRTLYQNRAKALEVKKQDLIKRFEDYYRVMDTDKLDKIKKDIKDATLLSVKAREHCSKTKQAVSDINVKLQKEGKLLQNLEEKINTISLKTQKFQKSKTTIKDGHKKTEQMATKVVEITHNIEKLSLELCKRTKRLNDYTISEADHNANFSRIKARQKSLRKLLDSSKNITKQMETLLRNIKKPDDYTDLFNLKTKNELAQKIKLTSSSSLANKKNMGQAASDLMEAKNSEASVKALKTSSKQGLKDFANELAQFLKINSGKKIKERIDKLNKSAEKIDITQCPEKVTKQLADVSKTFQAREKRIKKLTALYNNIQTEFDDNIKEAEILDMAYEKITYLIDLSKSYVKRAKDSAFNGALCIVLAENIMERVFIPDVTGLDISKAESMVRQKGLNVTKLELGSPPSEGKAGIVQKLTPGSTKRVKKGTIVTLSYYDESQEQETAELDCSQWPASQEMVNFNTGERLCDCLSPKIWNTDRTACIDKNSALPSFEEIEKARQELQLSLKDCSQFPGTKPVWDTRKDLAICVCKQGLIINARKNGCISQQQAALESVDCSQYPGTISNYDHNGNIECACPYGTQWIQNMNRCVDQQEIALANADCSHKPRSAPRWSYITNQVECECQSPYSLDPKTGKCVSFMAQLEQDQRAFDKEMENKRRRDREQQEQYFNNLMDVMGSLSQPHDNGNSNSNRNNQGSTNHSSNNHSNNTSRQSNHNQRPGSTSKKPAYCGIWKVTHKVIKHDLIIKRWGDTSRLGDTVTRYWKIFPINGGKTIEITKIFGRINLAGDLELDREEHKFTKPGQSGSTYSMTHTFQKEGKYIRYKHIIKLTISANSFHGTWTVYENYKSSGERKSIKQSSMTGTSKIRSYN